MRPDTPPAVLALAGPTAAGKSAAGLMLAEQLNGEIISVDSALVYRGLDIGSAKPTTAERARVPHHLIDIRDPTEPYSAAAFVRDALACIAAIQARDRLPILVGGTMLYFKALLHGLDDLPPADDEVRVHIRQRALQLGWPALHTELGRIDPVTAARLPPTDAQRIGRALEVWYQTGKPLSSWHTMNSIAPCASSTGAGDRLVTKHGWSVALLALEPTDRAWLHRRIAERWDTMMATGFLDEMRSLRQRADLHANLPALRAVGYRQAWQHLEAVAQPHNGGTPRPEASATWLREHGIAATRQLAKRQLTWLRSLGRRHIIAADALDVMGRTLTVSRVALGGAVHAG